MFTPIQRVVLVAVIGVAVAESRKNRLISQLRQSVEVRDQILSSMQQKLDDLCEEVRGVTKQSGRESEAVPSMTASGFPFDTNFDSEMIKFIECGCWLCNHHQKLFSDLEDNAGSRKSIGYDMLQSKANLLGEAEPEERRMSDLSDWASSVTSSADIQLNVLAMPDISNLKRECEEKDTTIRELTEILQSSDAAGSKRISELEDVIRRKNMIITKMRKDMTVLEQKVVQLTRLRRSSTEKEEEDDDSKRFPFMAENVLYNMDSTTSPSSSDSDGSPGSRVQPPARKFPETPAAEVLNSSRRTTHEEDVKLCRDEGTPSSRPGSPLREISPNQKLSRNPVAKSRQMHLASRDSKRTKAKGSKAVPVMATPKRRWS